MMYMPSISTRPIEMDVLAGVSITIKHGVGRQLFGWQIIWQDTPNSFSIVNPGEDTSNSITLLPSATGKVRLVLL